MKRFNSPLQGEPPAKRSSSSYLNPHPDLTTFEPIDRPPHSATEQPSQRPEYSPLSQSTTISLLRILFPDLAIQPSGVESTTSTPGSIKPPPLTSSEGISDFKPTPRSEGISNIRPFLSRSASAVASICLPTRIKRPINSPSTRDSAISASTQPPMLPTFHPVLRSLPAVIMNMIFRHLQEAGQYRSLAALMQFSELYDLAAKWLYRHVTLTRENTPGLYYGLPFVPTETRLLVIANAHIANAQSRGFCFGGFPATPTEDSDELAWPYVPCATADETFRGPMAQDFHAPPIPSQRKKKLLMLIERLDITSLPREFDLAGFLGVQRMQMRGKPIFPNIVHLILQPGILEQMHDAKDRRGEMSHLLGNFLNGCTAPVHLCVEAERLINREDYIATRITRPSAAEPWKDLSRQTQQASDRWQAFLTSSFVLPEPGSRLRTVTVHSAQNANCVRQRDVQSRLFLQGSGPQSTISDIRSALAPKLRSVLQNSVGGFNFGGPYNTTHQCIMTLTGPEEGEASDDIEHQEAKELVSALNASPGGLFLPSSAKPLSPALVACVSVVNTTRADPCICCGKK